MNDIVKKDELGLVEVVEKNDLQTLIKPLQREIFLFKSHIEGINLISNIENIIKDLKNNDVLTFKREKSKFNDFEIAIYSSNGIKLGYVPEMDNVIFSRLMDNGKMLNARIESIINNNKYKYVEINIYLIDF